MRKSMTIALFFLALTAAALMLRNFPQKEGSQSTQVRQPLPTATVQRVEDLTSEDEVVSLKNHTNKELPQSSKLAAPAPALLHQFETPKAPTVAAQGKIGDSVVVKGVEQVITPTPTDLAQQLNQAFEDPAISALNELQEDGPTERRTSSMIPGLVVHATSAPAQTANAPMPTHTPQIPAYERVVGQARGYAMLYMMHPRARQTVEREVETMLRAEVGDLYLSVIVDGTFGTDWEYLEQVIRRLVVEGRNLTLALYLTNGPTMRKYNKTPILTPFSRIEPTEFRYLIQVDTQMQATFRNTVASANKIFTLNKQLNVLNQNIAIVMLEDNLDLQSYRWMRKLARDVLEESTIVVRNPCPGCWPGSDTDGNGDPIEMHDPADLPALTSGDGYTLDGAGLRYTNEPPDEQLSVEEVKGLLDLSKKQSLRYFGLWRKQRQGLGNQLIHPDQRNYEIPSNEQMLQEIELLRYGLAPLR